MTNNLKDINNKSKLPKGESCMRHLFNRYKRDAKSRDIGFELSIEQFKEITQKDCFYCGSSPSQEHKLRRANGSYIYNGIDRVMNDQPYRHTNCVPCCWTCNNMKGTLGYGEFIHHLGIIYERLKPMVYFKEIGV